MQKNKQDKTFIKLWLERYEKEFKKMSFLSKADVADISVIQLICTLKDKSFLYTCFFPVTTMHPLGANFFNYAPAYSIWWKQCWHVDLEV